MARDLTRICSTTLLAPSTTTSCLKGGGLRPRVTARAFRELQLNQIEWVWIINEKRRATPEEIRALWAPV